MTGTPDAPPESTPGPRRHPRWIPWAIAGFIAALGFIAFRSPRHPAALIPRHLGVAAPPDVRVVRAFTERLYAAEPTWCLHLAGPSNRIAEIVQGTGFQPSGAPPSGIGSRGVGYGQPGWWVKALRRDRLVEFTLDFSHPGKKHQVENLFIHESGGELLYRGFDP